MFGYDKIRSFRQPCRLRGQEFGYNREPIKRTLQGTLKGTGTPEGTRAKELARSPKPQIP